MEYELITDFGYNIEGNKLEYDNLVRYQNEKKTSYKTF